MDDVDRLFQCFKCGVSPPQSAVREQKADKAKLKQASPTEKCSSFSKLEKQQQNESHLQFGSGTVKENINKRKNFSPVIFYGSPHGVPPKRPARLLRLLREIRVDLAEQHKLREEVWATFPRQDEAMKYAKEHTNLRLFSYQDRMNGIRRFLVSTYAVFWQRYKSMNCRYRHHYEVIQEGLPCHLYFDLEFNKRDNTEKNGEEMVDLLLSVVFDALYEKYSIQGDHDWVVELDSSNEEKFSRHLIIRLQKTAFKDNSHAGAFVAEICSRIYSTKASDKRLEKLFISKDSGSAGTSCQLFVDTAVYSRNRVFRLHLSSKAGKKSVLLPTGRFKCKNLSEEDVFMASLICNMDVDCEKLLICKMDLDCVKTLHFDTEIHCDLQQQPAAPRDFSLYSCTSSDASRTYLMGRSPFPALDMFVESIASIGDVSGKIRSWYWFSEYGLMVYSMSRNRYCERIGRQHKSNHVIYIVDLRMSVYYQKCHDPDCRGYRSPLRPLPEGVIPDDTISQNSGGNHKGNQGIVDEDENILDSCKRDGWWQEAARFADTIESMPTMLDLSGTEKALDGDEDDWWMAVENTVAQVELTYS